MKNENIITNETDMSVNSTSTVLAMNDSNGTVSSTDIENGTVELVLKQPFA